MGKCGDYLVFYLYLFCFPLNTQMPSFGSYSIIIVLHDTIIQTTCMMCLMDVCTGSIQISF